MPADQTPARVPADERLFSLVLALLATDTGLTKAEILSTVRGYAQRYSHTGDNANLERQFERDKDDIRDLGVPLETIDQPGQPGDNHSLRYRIPRGDYELPTDVRFTPEETALLNLAAMVWREGSISAESGRALLKIRSLGVTTSEPVLAYAPQVRVRDAAFEPLRAAIQKSVRVRFSYLKPGEGEARERLVEPLALVQHQGRWHLFAHDPQAGVTKTFLLRRIVSAVKATTTAFVAPAGDQSEIALTELQQVWNARTATIEVTDGSDASARLVKRPGTTVLDSGVLELHYADPNILADELAAYGPEVLVLSPEELRTAVIERLTATAADHG